MKVTEELIESRIVGKYFFNLGDAVKSTCTEVAPKDLARMSLVTKCVLVLENGYTIVGHSACVDPAIYNEQLDQQYAYKNAIDKIWALEGYVLANQMHEQSLNQEMLKGFADGDCDGCKI